MFYLLNPQYYLLRIFGIFWCARYNVSPLILQSRCDVCGTAFRLTHTLSWIIGSLVIKRHKEICDKILYISWHAFTSASVRTEPLLHQGRAISKQEICQSSEKDKETRLDVMIRCLLDCQVDAIIDIKLGDNDADTYKYEPMTALLSRSENIKKDKHGKHCHDQLLFFAVCPLSGRNAGEGRPSHDLSIDSSHLVFTSIVSSQSERATGTESWRSKGFGFWSHFWLLDCSIMCTNI